MTAPRKAMWDETEARRVHGDTRAVVGEFLGRPWHPEGEIAAWLRDAIDRQDLGAYRDVCRAVRRAAYALLLRDA